MHVMMSVDETRRTAHGGLERTQLALDLGPDFFPVEPSQIGDARQPAEARHPPVRSCPWHVAEGFMVRQCQVQADIDLADEGLQPCRVFLPEGAGGHATGGRQPRRLE
jgi:hypothetical protein